MQAMDISLPYRLTECASTEDPEEAHWLDRARAGEEAAYCWLLARYRRRVVRLAFHVLRHSEEAEDAAQEAFLRAFRNLYAFRGEGCFYTWLYHIVVRVCLDRKRSARWRSEVSATNLFETNHEKPGPGSSQESLRSSPTDGVETQLLIDTLLSRLSPPMRAALILREVEGLEYEEIARVLEIPVGTVRSRLNTARAQFRDLWDAARKELEGV